jgi:hypothetical protein
VVLTISSGVVFVPLIRDIRWLRAFGFRVSVISIYDANVPTENLLPKSLQIALELGFGCGSRLGEVVLVAGGYEVAEDGVGL